MRSEERFLSGVLLSVCLFAAVPPQPAHAALDTLVFGDSGSETAHSLASASTTAFTGALGEPARRCKPLSPADYHGGTLTFTMTVDPFRRNYFTVKLWSNDDTNEDIGRLYLYIPVDGVDYQVGFRHEGDYMPLSVPYWQPGSPGQFFYSTTLLPLVMTRGKTSITLKIVSMGRLYGLGGGGEKDGGNYQFLMDTDSRGIYRAYTHVDPYLDVTGETQGSVPANLTTRPSPGEESLQYNGTFYNQVKNWINNRLSTSISANSTTFLSTFSTRDVSYLARSYSAAGLSGQPNLPGYHDAAVVAKVVALLDAYAKSYYEDNSRAQGWGGNYGALGRAIFYLQDYQSAQLLSTALLDTVVNYGVGGSKTRREAWGDMLFASRENGRLFQRRTLSNQTIIANASIYYANKGLLAIGDSRAFPEVDAQRYIKEACGLLPWLGNDLPDSNGNGLPDDGSEMPYGSQYYQVTDDGQTREWGYVGAGYGDLAYYLAEWYRMSGNTDIQQQMVKMAKARAPFRRPAVEVNGSSNYRTMKAVGLLAWRGAHESDGEYAGYVAYASTANTGEGPKGLITAARSEDPALIGYAKQMLLDNQYFTYLPGYYKVMEALDLFDDYETVKNATDSGLRLPMTDGQPDFAWSDEGNRILALKHGDDRLWITPYWQAKTGSGINGVARFLFSNADHTQYGVLETVPQFTFGGSFERTMADIDKPEGFQWLPPDPRPLQAYGGEILPLGPTPAEASSDAPFRGKADFYAFRFGRYLMGINASGQKSYTLKTPVGFASATDLISSNTLSGTIPVAPASSLALVLAETVDAAPVPTAPLYLDVANGGSGVALLWSAASGAETYSVTRSVTSGGPYTIVASGVAGLSWVDTNVVAGQTYHYEVTAANANGESYPSHERSITASQAPDVISFNLLPSGNTTMTAAHNAGAPGVRVANWNMFAGGTLSSGIVDGGGQTVPGMSVTLSLGSTGGFSDRGGSIGDDVSMFRTVLDQFNGTPSTIAASGIPFSSYDVYFYVHGDEDSVGANDRGGSFTVGSTTYYIRTGSDTKITSSDGSGYIQSSDTTYGTGMDVELGNYIVFSNRTGNLSASLVALVMNGGAHAHRLKVSGFQIVKSASVTPPPPAAPEGLDAGALSSGRLDLSWSASSGADSYTVKRADSGGGPYTPVISGVTGTTFSDSGLVDGETYYYVVSANGAGGESADSIEAHAVPSGPVTQDEYKIDRYAVTGGTNLALVVSNSVIGHLYQLLGTDSLVPADWQPARSAVAGNGLNLLFELPIIRIAPSGFFKLDVQRQ